jgi:hypothetical protein
MELHRRFSSIKKLSSATATLICSAPPAAFSSARPSLPLVLTVKFRQPSHEFTFGVDMSFILYPTNPLGITSSFVHVGFGV